MYEMIEFRFMSWKTGSRGGRWSLFACIVFSRLLRQPHSLQLKPQTIPLQVDIVHLMLSTHHVAMFQIGIDIVNATKVLYVVNCQSLEKAELFRKFGPAPNIRVTRESTWIRISTPVMATRS